jgi:large subunit ribosomal protein L13
MAEHVINGEGKILGRLASSTAKILLNGESVTVVNAEKILISGHVRDMFSKYKQRVEFKDKANPEHSPYYSRRPDLFVKRVVRGMLPYKKPRGKAAYKRLLVYMGVPKNIKIAESKIKIKEGSEVYEKLISVSDLTAKLGYKTGSG